jgi:hypothetical protein
MEEFAAVSGISRPTVSKYFHDPTACGHRRGRGSRRRWSVRLPAQHLCGEPEPQADQERRHRGALPDRPVLCRDRAQDRGTLHRRRIPADLYSPYGQPDLEVEILDSLRSLKPAGVLLAPLGRARTEARSKNSAPMCRRSCLTATLRGGRSLCRIGQFQLRLANGRVPGPHGIAAVLLRDAHAREPERQQAPHAYIEMMERHGLEPHAVSGRGRGLGVRGDRARMARAHPRRPGGFRPTPCCAATTGSPSVFCRPAMRRGLRVGRGEGCALRVASHDDHPFSRFTCPSPDHGGA